MMKPGKVREGRAALIRRGPAPKAAVAFSFAAALLFGIAEAGRGPSLRSSNAVHQASGPLSPRRLREQSEVSPAEREHLSGDDASGVVLGEEQGADPLIELAVVGFEKCGTSFLMDHMLSIDEVYMGGKTEHCLSTNGLKNNFIDRYTEHLGEVTSEGFQVKRGLKCPRDLQDKYGISNYEQYFPNIKLVISTRHPVLWFQSFYNYRLSQVEKNTGEVWHPPVKDLIGQCVEGSPYMQGEDGHTQNEKRSVCTDGANFHHYLSRLGKTSMDTEEEMSLLKHEMSMHSLPDAKIFLMEIGQFSLENETLASTFEDDLGTFLDLNGHVQPLKHHRSRAKRPIADATKDIALDICDEKHDLVRSILVKAGRDAFVWIRDFFLRSPDVVVSSREHFLELIKMWQYDPCDSEDERLRKLLLEEEF